MKSVRKYYVSFVIIALGCITITGQNVFSPQERSVVAALEQAANDYIKQRNRIERKLPKLSKKATAEQIEAHKTALLKAVQAARQGLPQGTIFKPEVSRLIRAIIKRETQGVERARLREVVFEAENKAVPVRANYPYPESQELLEMPPELLLALPQLPKQLRYRFVGKNLLLVDRDSLLIVDYMTNAVP